MLTNKAETTVSSLIIQKAGVSDGGVYSCQAGQIDPTSVKIHVLTGKTIYILRYLLYNYHISPVACVAGYISKNRTHPKRMPLATCNSAVFHVFLEIKPSWSHKGMFLLDGKIARACRIGDIVCNWLDLTGWLAQDQNWLF